VARGLDEGVKRVAQGTGEQHARPRKPPAQALACEEAKEDTEDKVPYQVDRVGVKTEGSEGAPPFALLDKTGVALARIPPVEGEGSMPLQKVHKQ
jgi:hypothetical protein